MSGRLGLGLTISTTVWLATVLASPLALAAPHAREAGGSAPREQPEDAEYRSAIKGGDRAFLAKRFDEAVTAYEKAIAKQPASAEAYGRLAAAQRELGRFDEAIATLGQGLDKSTDVTERAKLLFLQADIRERQRALPEAAERWSAYLDTASGGEVTIDLDAPEAAAESTAAPGAKVYPATAHERLKQVAAAEKRQKDYASVKDRIKKREQQAEAKARSAK
jgi:tetratricopeptide (TPR) repeat protein